MGKNFKGSKMLSDGTEFHIVMLKARNKDNKHLPNFKERTIVFLTDKKMYDEEHKAAFEKFVEKGQDGEVCRFYYSVNARDAVKCNRALICYLVEHIDEFNIAMIENIAVSIAAEKENAATKHWMFDFDIDDADAVEEFVKDIHECDADVEVTVHKTPHGYAVVTNRGFDTQNLYKKWDRHEVELKRDDYVIAKWATKGEPIVW